MAEWKQDGKEGDPRVVYADIIDLPRWESPVRPRMSERDRAAQFQPYAALTGYADKVKEVTRETEPFRELSEDEAAELSGKLSFLAERLRAGVLPVCTLSWFVPDEYKEGGRTVTSTETIRRIDAVRRKIVLQKTSGPAGSYEEIDIGRLTDVTWEEDPGG